MKRTEISSTGNIGENRIDLSGDFDERMFKVCRRDAVCQGENGVNSSPMNLNECLFNLGA